MRPNKDKIFLDIAESLALRGTCIRKQVGCVITDIHGYITSTGYNGVARGLPHCNEEISRLDKYNEYLKSEGLSSVKIGDNYVDMSSVTAIHYPFKCAGADHDSGQGLEICEAIHAEQNALLQCHDVQQIDTVYVTTSPCRHCMKLIMNTSAKRVVFLSEYSQSSKDLAEKAGIQWVLFAD